MHRSETFAVIIKHSHTLYFDCTIIIVITYEWNNIDNIVFSFKYLIMCILYYLKICELIIKLMNVIRV